MRAAVIDVGTNSVKLYIAERTGGTALLDVGEACRITRLGAGICGGMLQAEAMARTAQAVADFAKEALQKGAEQLACVGTMALRQAENAQSFFDRVHALCGVDVRVLSGEEEARLCYRAALMDVQGEKGTLAVIDSGGGSTEIALGSAASPQMRASLPIGAVSVTETYLRPFATAEALDNAQAAMRTAFARSGICPRAQTVVAAGGTATTMAAVMLRLAPYDAKKVRGVLLTLAEAQRQRALYASLTPQQRALLPGMHSGREDVILAGACILLQAFEYFNVDCLRVVDRGLRHALALEMLD